jgi:uncharacterized protein (TIGR01244 family)
MRYRAVLMAVLAGAAMQSEAGMQQRGTETVPGARNYTRVDATVACAGATPVEVIPTIGSMGFAAIINLRTAGEPGADIDASREAAEAAGVRYIHIPFDNRAPSPEVADRFLEAIADSGNQPAYVHCGTANRVGAVWLIKRVLQDGWGLEEAEAEAAAIGLRSPELREFALTYIERHRVRGR